MADVRKTAVVQALRDCAAILQAEATYENRRYRVDGRVITIKQALDAANAALAHEEQSA